ncbi:helix-turn-helix transcriptional regulator [Citrobacter koseri]|nr:helix-turn-helix transcriptional regulator [Citrobacter koseri]HEJ0063841.1 helix-turn-helix transcriptional regulator [Citrobacter koseri]HEM8491677.1 helix-turn-helix transcriptional regulator [Citrobacter koseri]
MNNIAKKRKRAGLTQVEFASVLGWKPSRLSNYELALRMPSLNDCRAIVNELNNLGCECSLDDIFPHPSSDEV